MCPTYFLLWKQQLKQNKMMVIIKFAPQSTEVFNLLLRCLSKTVLFGNSRLLVTSFLFDFLENDYNAKKVSQ